MQASLKLRRLSVRVGLANALGIAEGRVRALAQPGGDTTRNRQIIRRGIVAPELGALDCDAAFVKRERRVQPLRSSLRFLFGEIGSTTDAHALPM